LVFYGKNMLFTEIGYYGIIYTKYWKINRFLTKIHTYKGGVEG